ncbi:MAG: glycosyltransferase family 39 protein, partial [Chlorobi bacterium]|nr:glycosyltransferase family 39 protein [Chlorobiota bacterium]
AFSLRLGWVIAKPLKSIEKDAVHYDDIAVNLLAGKGFSFSDEHLLPADRVPDRSPQPTARRLILYPIFLAGVYKLFGRNFAAVGVVQALLSTFTVYLIYLLGRMVFGKAQVGLVGAAMAAVYLPFIRYTNSLLTETLFLLLSVLGFYYMLVALREGRIKWSFVAGTIGGLAFLCRPTAVGFPLVFIFLAFLAFRFGVRRRLVLKSAVYFAAFLVFYCAWVARNYHTFGAFIPGFTSSGYNLFVGSYPPARGKANIPLNAHPAELRKELEGKGEIEANRLFMQAALGNIRDHPGAYLKLVAMKFVRAWFNIKRGHDWFPTGKSLVLNGLLLFLAIISAVLHFKKDTFAVLFLASPVVYFTLFHALVVSSTRYNLPSVPFAVIFAAVALEEAGRMKRYVLDHLHHGT